jgi:hypothetical protein
VTRLTQISDAVARLRGRLGPALASGATPSRDTIRSWFVGCVKEKISPEKVKSTLRESKVGFFAKISGQSTGGFHGVHEGRVDRTTADLSVLDTEQLPKNELLRLATSQPQMFGPWAPDYKVSSVILPWALFSFASVSRSWTSTSKCS